MPIADIEVNKNKLIPDTKIKITQLKTISNVCPKSGCKINSKTIKDVSKKEIENLAVKFDNLLLINE